MYTEQLKGLLNSFKSINRFSVRIGKFGCYFYDSKHDLALSLSNVKDILNSYYKYRFLLCSGKYGYYFYDLDSKMECSLTRIKGFLNHIDLNKGVFYNE